MKKEELDKLNSLQSDVESLKRFKTIHNTFAALFLIGVSIYLITKK